MDKLILQWMFVAVWIIVVCGIAIYPMWAHEYRKIQRLRMAEQQEAEREEQARAFFESLTPEELERVDRAAQALTDIVNASTISIKDIEL